MKSLFPFLMAVLLATCVKGKTLDLDERWSVEIPEEWRYSDTHTLGPLRVYTFGISAPVPMKGAPVFLVDVKRKTSTPELIRGVSIGIALEPVECITMMDTEKIARPDGWLGAGYRKEISTVNGNLILHVFVFRARKLPGEPLPNPDARWVMVQIGGKTDDEAEQFTKIFEGIKASVAK